MSGLKPITVSDIIRGPKQDVKCGEWAEGTVPHAQFPLGRGKRSLGRGWKWRSVKFSCLGQDFFVLVALNVEKEYYRATLGMKDGKSLKVVCCHELHTDHLNWHCHVVRGNVHETFPGVSRDKNLMIAWPVFTKMECTVTFNVTEKNALSIAAARFGFAEGGALL
ncbi:MAG: hypothetical protein ABJH07_27180 [Sedimentitalea sp.]|uniref:hypothetical protein n=1 Tax=Sedimentitalea sp. TaxID=2048915 RepID=UPI003263786E